MERPSAFLRRQWNSRPLAVFSVCFLTGILFGDDDRLPLLLCALVFLLVLFLQSFLKKQNKRRSAVLMAASVILLGCLWMKTAIILNPLVPDMYSVEFSGTVVSDPYYNEETQRIVCSFRLDQADGRDINGKVRLYLRSDVVELKGIEYGQKLTCFGHVWPQDPATNPYEYDAQKSMRADGLVGMAAAKREDVCIEPAEYSLGRCRISIIQAISMRIDNFFPNNPELVRAFVLGDRSDVSDDLREAFNTTGVAHLISISGLHITVIASGVLWFVQLFLTKRKSFFITLGAVLLYGLLIGFPPALVRATVMFAILSFAPLVGRPSDPFTRLGAALLLMLVLNPFNVYDGGFVLSFVASAGILMLMKPIEQLLRIDILRDKLSLRRMKSSVLRKVLLFFPETLCVTLAAQIAMLPVVIAYFGAQSLISVPVNLMVIPIAMAAYPLALIALIISVVWQQLGILIAQAADGMFSLLVILVDFFADVRISELRVPCYSLGLKLLHCTLMIFASGMAIIPSRLRRFLPMGLALLVTVSMTEAWIYSQGFKVVFLDAGQADAAVVHVDGNVHMFDVGDIYSPSADYAGGACLKIDSVFLSHPHYDHAGGLSELLDVMPPEVIYVPLGWFDTEDVSDTVAEGIAKAAEMGIPIIELEAGDVIKLSDDAIVSVLAPSEQGLDPNDMSLVLQVTHKDNGLLFTGDMTADCEPESVFDVDVLKVPHHGSARACSEHFLEQTSPGVSVISVGENNYGHPSDETITRLRASGSDVYRTDECGAITIRFDSNGGFRIKTYLPQEELK